MRVTRTFMVALGALLLALGTSVASVAQTDETAGDDDSPQVILDWNVNTLGAAVTAGIAPAVTNLYMAMVHGAIYDAVNAIAGKYQPYMEGLAADPTASKVAAAAAAAHGVLAGSFPDQAADLQALLEASLATVPDGAAKDAGIAVGEAAAAAMLAARGGDGRGADYPLTFGEGPGEYRPTPPTSASFHPPGWPTSSLSLLRAPRTTAPRVHMPSTAPSTRPTSTRSRQSVWPRVRPGPMSRTP